MTMAREIHLVSRPQGMPKADNFLLVERELPALQPGQVRVKNLYMSVDPYMRGRMRADAVYAAAYELNQVMYGGAIGEVEESASDALQPGDIVMNQCAWRDRFVADAQTLNRFEPFDRDRLSLYLGTLGMPGMTAWLGLQKYGEPVEGETVFVSAASGAVGANVCQIARMKGCRVVGSVGSDEKAAWLRDDCGVDAVLNYRSCGDLGKALAEAAPEGVDVYFENVGGDHLQAAIANMNPYGRIVACGMIHTYNNASPAPGPSNLMLIVGKKLRIQGLIVSDHMDQMDSFLAEMTPWVRDGRIKSKETVIDGIERAVAAFQGLFSGDNFGKMIVRL
jgi:NADPH-dependent curcumin reductase CurA